MRKKVIAGNWKMHLAKQGAQTLMEQLVPVNIHADKCSVIILPPIVYLESFISNPTFKKPGLFFGAQNCSGNEQGAFTGEISADMLSSLGVEYCLVGHSERRQHNHEQDADCHAKLRALLKNAVTPIFCVGEQLKDREFGKQNELVETQLREGLFDLSSEEISKVIIAYEPVWAIGTGKTATTKQASEMHSFIRDWVSAHYKQPVADKIHILYGGSVKENNAKELMSAEDIDGVLVGGASLSAESFGKIIAAV